MKLLFPFRYLRLENAHGRYLLRRDLIPSILIAATLILPFIIFTEANYFHKDGFLDKVGAFSAILTGFYVAALIAVATLSSTFADLDKTIIEGEIRLPSTKGENGEKLTRREYVCYIFGYLAFLSLFLTFLSIIAVVLSPLIAGFSYDLVIGGGLVLTFDREFARGVAIMLLSLPISSLAITTVRGLYYLVERLYAQLPVVNQKRKG